MKTRTKTRINELVNFDIATGCPVIGTDEAGRGPLAGPVMAGAVFFPKFNDEVRETLKFIDDSKKFGSNHKLRIELAEQIKKVAIYSISQCSVEEIQQYNILQASLLAMKRACEEVLSAINVDNNGITVLIDGRFAIPSLKTDQKPVKKGDTLSFSIAAASILAKVHRDCFMRELAEQFPLYNWQKNKGYPTKEHIEAIKIHGHCEWHRKTFLRKIFLTDNY